MVQKGKTFTPHVLAIPVGATVDFPNYDPIFHNAFSNYNGQVFDVDPQLCNWVGGPKAQHRLQSEPKIS